MTTQSIVRWNTPNGRVEVPFSSETIKQALLTVGCKGKFFVRYHSAWTTCRWSDGTRLLRNIRAGVL